MGCVWVVDVLYYRQLVFSRRHSMYLSKRKNGNHYYLSLVESIRVNGQVYKKTVKQFGRIDLLDPQFVKELEEQYAKQKLSKQLTAQQQRDDAVKAVQKLQRNAIAGDSHFNKAPLLRYGHLPLKALWEKVLGLKYKLDRLQDTESDISSYKINDIAFYLTALKVLDPKSYLGAYQAQSSFLYNPIAGIALDNIYAALTFLHKFKDDILSHAVKKINEHYHGEPRLIFYDCTNCYFESPYDDKEQFIHNYTVKVKRSLEKAGYSETEINDYLQSKEFREELTEEVASRTFYRMRGPSKESRFAQPLTAIALVVDDRGMVLDYTVFPGNLSEFKTLEPAIKKLQDKYRVKNSYVVADRGLNSVLNLKMLKQKELGFIVAQKVSYQGKKLREMMLSENGWNINDAVSDASFRYKVCDYVKSARVKQDDGKERLIKQPCKIIFTYSEKRYKKDIYELDNAVARAQKALDEKKLLKTSFGSGWRSLVATKAETVSGEEKEMYRVTGLKEDVIAERRATAGYAAVVFSPPEGLNKDEQFTVEEILTAYKRLVKIEDCFRVMKSTFSIRPMFVRQYEHINAHCLLCVLALNLLRVIELKLNDTNNSLNLNDISQALSSAKLVMLPTGTDEPLFINCKEFNDIYTKERVKPGRNKAAINELNDVAKIRDDYMQERTEKADTLDRILQALDLTPLPLYATLNQVQKALKIRISVDKMIDPTLSAVGAILSQENPSKTT